MNILNTSSKGINIMLLNTSAKTLNFDLFLYLTSHTKDIDLTKVLYTTITRNNNKKLNNKQKQSQLAIVKYVLSKSHQTVLEFTRKNEEDIIKTYNLLLLEHLININTKQ